MEIFKHLKGRIDARVEILFAGSGPNLEELTELLKGQSQFKSLGFRNDVRQLMSECDFVMLFSKHEGLPISLIEADMCGAPVICNDVGGNAEIVRNGENGFIVNEWNSLVDVLNSLPSMDKEMYRRMSQAGRKIYDKNFTFETFKQNYLRLIDNVENSP